jgi:predicted RNA methylase
MQEARSGIAPENIQEVIDAEYNASNAKQNQYYTPSWLVDQCVARLPNSYPHSVLDPQCGACALIDFGVWRYGVDIDNRLGKLAFASCHQFVMGNCVKVFEAMDDLYPDLHWECANANPPFGRKWKLADGTVVDSTEWTWNTVTNRANYGFFISNHGTIEKLGINQHPWVFHYETHPGVALWKGVHDTLIIGVAVWRRPDQLRLDISGMADLGSAFTQLQRVVDQEKVSRPDFNIYLDPQGYLRTYLSVRSEVKQKLAYDKILRLHRVNGCHPLALTTDKETRDLMRELTSCGIYKIQPEALAAINQALAEVASVACPIMPVTNFESVAYADEEDALECRVDTQGPDYYFTRGRRYPIKTGVYKFTETFKRNKVHYSEKDMLTYTKEHECELTGQDRYIAVTDDRGVRIIFMARPVGKNQYDEIFMARPVGKNQYDESRLWDVFNKPAVKTVRDVSQEKIEQNLAVLRSCEMLAGFDYYPGQIDYLATVAAKDSGLIAAATGTGKTLFAISLLAMKTPQRALIIAPQGTMRSSEDEPPDEGEEVEEYNASQWVTEINRFAPYLQIWEIFSYEDYERICTLNNGTLPPGVYVSYYEAMFVNKARENAPESWDDTKLNKFVETKFELPPLQPPVMTGGKTPPKRFWSDTVGTENNGIRCIISPCLATLIGKDFDMVILDEAHKCTNLNAMVTQMLIRLQPKYRWALTATPIPNIVTNLFSLMGWLAVPGWYKGGIRNAAWPFAREEISRFNSTFLSNERDITQEEDNRRADPKWRGSCVKPSPVISSPARLLKLLKPSMAFIGKEACNPNYIPPKIVDVRVPMGKEQSKLYAYYLDRSRIPGGNPLVRARKQTAWLRNICADPAGFRHGGKGAPVVSSNMNPKVVSMLELTRDILSEGEQVVIINSRVGITNTLQHKLAEAGIPLARIDSTIPADQHAFQANLFKRGKARVNLMGIKCAAAYSFDQCKYLIVGSIEYSPGPFNQAIGRIDRVTNAVLKTIYVILHKNSIEEVQFDVVATKDDAATICLKGRRAPRDFKPVDGSEILAAAIEHFDVSGATPENECEAKWPTLREALRLALNCNQKLNKTPIQ